MPPRITRRSRGGAAGRLARRFRDRAQAVRPGAPVGRQPGDRGLAQGTRAPEVARDEVTARRGRGLEQERLLLGAAHRAAEPRPQLAARVEPAARRRPDRARDVALEDDPLPALLRIRHGDRRQQGLRVRMERAAEHRDPVGDLRELADVHHRHPVGDVLHHAHVVGDEQVRQVELPLERLEQVEDLCLDRHVERRHRLVTHDEVRLDDEGSRDPDALPLAARELVRVAPRVVGHQPDQVHHPADLRRALRRRPHGMDPQPLADALPDRRPRVERGVRVLEDDLHPPPVRLEFAALDRRDVGSVELDRAGRGLDQPQQQPPDRGLARARLANEPERLAATDLEAHAGHRLDDGDRPVEEPAPDREVLDEVAHLDERRLALRAGVARRRHGRRVDGGHEAPASAGAASSRPGITSLVPWAARTGSGFSAPVASWYNQQRTSCPVP